MAASRPREEASAATALAPSLGAAPETETTGKPANWALISKRSLCMQFTKRSRYVRYRFGRYLQKRADRERERREEEEKEKRKREEEDKRLEEERLRRR